MSESASVALTDPSRMGSRNCRHCGALLVTMYSASKDEPRPSVPALQVVAPSPATRVLLAKGINATKFTRSSKNHKESCSRRVVQANMFCVFNTLQIQMKKQPLCFCGFSGAIAQGKHGPNSRRRTGSSPWRWRTVAHAQKKQKRTVRLSRSSALAVACREPRCQALAGQLVAEVVSDAPLAPSVRLFRRRQSVGYHLHTSYINSPVKKRAQQAL